MFTRHLARISLFAALLLMTVSLATAQTARPLPTAQVRGVIPTSAPFDLPAEYAAQTRATAYTVTTTADRNNTSCTLGDLSLREALGPDCDTNRTVYVPAGTYTLSSAIIVADGDLLLIGESPSSTFIESVDAPRAGTSGLLLLTPDNRAITLANLTFRNGSSASGAVNFNGGGSLTVFNSLFEDNFGVLGGALYIQDDDDPLSVTLRQSEFSGNQADEDGAAVYIRDDQGVASNVHIQDSLFFFNTAGLIDCSRGGAVNVTSTSDNGGSLIIDNSLFELNSFDLPDCDGSAVSYYNSQGSGLFSISYSAFYENTASGAASAGGAVYIDNDYGILRVSHSEFLGNMAAYGGAIYVLRSGDVTFSDSLLAFNEAVSSGGAAQIFSNIYSFTAIDSDFLDNSAGSVGGALRVDAKTVTLENSDISTNVAGDIDGLNGFGGGIFFNGDHMALHNTLIEDNVAENGSQCYNDSEDSDTVVSVGGNGMTSTIDCTFVATDTDQYDNLLLNGGFETGFDVTPEFWTLKNITGDGPNCDPFTNSYGVCEYVLKGNPNTNTVLSQNIDVLLPGFTTGDELILYAEGDGAAASNVQVLAKATYTNTALGKSKAKLKFIGANPFYVAKSDSMVLLDGDLSKLQVKITDKSPGGKFYIDRVYLYRTVVIAPPRGEGAATLPLPSVPDGFRGGN
jgi:hypothetical protein